MKEAETAPPHALAKLAILISGNVLMIFMVGALIPASGAVAGSFAALGHADIRAQIVLLAPYLALIFVAPLSGALIQRWGRRVPLLTAFALYAVTGAISLFVDNFWLLVLVRMALGAAGGAMSTICMTLAGDYFTGARRTWAIALVGMATAPASVAVMLVSGLLVDWGGWHMAFLPFLLAFPVFFAALFIIKEPQQVAEIARETGRLPRGFQLLCAITVFQACLGSLPPMELPFLLIAQGVRNVATASFIIALSAAVAVGFGSTYPLIRRKISVNALLGLMFITTSISLVACARATGIPGLVFALLVAGFSGGLIIPHFSALAIERSSVEARGRAVGLITSAIFLGQILIPVIAEPLRAAFGMAGMFEVLAIVLLGAACANLAIPRLGRVQRVTN